MGSQRLPGKVLKDIIGRPMLDLQIERLERVQNADQIIVATSNHTSDDPLEEFCISKGYKCFRGSVNNVLNRFYQAALFANADTIVRVNGDCPLIDPEIISSIIDFYTENKHKYDYCSNILEDGFPIGLHTEVFSLNALSLAEAKSIDSIEREHVTPYIYRNPDLFRLYSYRSKYQLSNHRWTVDYEEDFKLVEKVYENLYPLNKNFGIFDVVDFLNTHPDIMNLNNHIKKLQTI